MNKATIAYHTAKAAQATLQNCPERVLYSGLQFFLEEIIEEAKKGHTRITTTSICTPNGFKNFFKPQLEAEGFRVNHLHDWRLDVSFGHISETITQSETQQ